VLGLKSVEEGVYTRVATGIMQTCAHSDRQHKLIVKRGPNPVVMFRANPNPKL